MKQKTKLKKYLIAIVAILIFAACFIPPQNYNSKNKLDIVSPYGDNEAYHPKVINFKEKWNGYKYWMSYTPYPQGDDLKENPCIAVSNDLITWETPKGLKNPIDEPETKQKGKRYNSDSHIVYNDILNRMECYWRYVDNITNKVIIYRSYSLDGINWSPKEIAIMSNSRKKTDYVSPAIVFENGIYKMWYVDTKCELKYTTSLDGTKWDNPQQLELKYGEKVKTWHIDVINTGKKYEMLVVAFKDWNSRNNMDLYYTSSTNGTDWEKAEIIMKPTRNTEYWDNMGIYRSSFIYEGGVYFVYYGATQTNYQHGIGLMYGKDIHKLKRINIDYKNKKDVEKLKLKIQKEKNI